MAIKDSPWTKAGVILSGLGLLIAYLTLTNPPERPESTPPPESVASEPRYDWISGGYRGTCFNTTYGVRANLRLVMRAEDSGRISGTVTISGNLTGSGAFEGYTDGTDIAFTSQDPTTGVMITWDGTIDGSTISGDYAVSLPAYIKQQNPYAVDDEGTWKVSK